MSTLFSIRASCISCKHTFCRFWWYRLLGLEIDWAAHVCNFAHLMEDALFKRLKDCGSSTCTHVLREAQKVFTWRWSSHSELSFSCVHRRAKTHIRLTDDPTVTFPLHYLSSIVKLFQTHFQRQQSTQHCQNTTNTDQMFAKTAALASVAKVIYPALVDFSHRVTCWHVQLCLGSVCIYRVATIT